MHRRRRRRGANQFRTDAQGAAAAGRLYRAGSALAAGAVLGPQHQLFDGGVEFLPAGGADIGLGGLGLEDGPVSYTHLFANDQSHPLLILKGSDPVGFALVSRPRIPAAGETSANYNMSEFFVRKAYRRVGIGLSLIHI